MALINRLARLVTADVHAVLDRLEEPEPLLRQAVREMEEELAAGEQRLRRRRRERERLAARGEELERSLAQLEQELDTCFAAGEDSLARAVVRRKLEAEQARQNLARRLAELDKELAQSEASVNENRVRLDSMRQKAELLSEEAAGADNAPPRDGQPCGVRDDDVEVAFLREKQRRAAR